MLKPNEINKDNYYFVRSLVCSAIKSYNNKAYGIGVSFRGCDTAIIKLMRSRWRHLNRPNKYYLSHFLGIITNNIVKLMENFDKPLCI